jgi:4-amino-4-deoxy-L-arabinose transferase-like glycosyltransferase
MRLGFIATEHYHTINDSGTYNRLASMVANHGDYHTGDKPKAGAGGSRGPTAYFPPAFPYFLAVADLIDGHTAGGPTAVGGERIEMAIAGTITVGLTGLVAFEAFGEVAGLAALAIAAFYPVLVELSGTLVAENLLVLFELAATYTALRARRARHPYLWFAATGLLTGLATLTHENAALFVIPFGLAAWGIARRRTSRARPSLRALAAPAVLLVFTAAMIAPWTIRNADELHAFVPVSDEAGITLVGTYNPVSAAYAPVPYKWRLFSHLPQNAQLAKVTYRYTEVGLGNLLQTQALDYIKAHPLAPVEVAFHNTLRMFELEGTFAWHASATAIGLADGAATFGVAAFYVLCVLALIGIFTPVARRGPRWLWAVPFLYALSVVLVNVETPRFREPVDPFLIMLAACAVATALRRLGLGRAPVRSGRRTPELARDAERVEVVQRLA